MEDDVITRDVVRRYWHQNQHFIDDDMTYRVKPANKQPSNTHAYKEELIGRIIIEPGEKFHKPQELSHLLTTISVQSEEAEVYLDKLMYDPEFDYKSLDFKQYSERSITSD